MLSNKNGSIKIRVKDSNNCYQKSEQALKKAQSDKNFDLQLVNIQSKLTNCKNNAII